MIDAQSVPTKATVPTRPSQLFNLYGGQNLTETFFLDTYVWIVIGDMIQRQTPKTPSEQAAS